METESKANTRLAQVIAVTSLIVVAAALAISLLLSGWPSSSLTKRSEGSDEKVYVALEEEGKVAVLDPTTEKTLVTIDLIEETSQGTVRYMAHNVQVTPNGNAVLVTANVDADMNMEGSSAGMDMPHAAAYDQLIVISPETDTVTRRIPIDTDSHLAHVVATADGRTAYVTLQEKGLVYVVDLERGAVTGKINLGEKSGPHGLRLTPDGKQLVIALLDGRGVAFVDTITSAVRIAKLPGAVVQAAVTQDGAYAFASVYDTKEVAWFSLQSDERGTVSLPEGARGPVQLYPTPDSKYLYVADQGYYFDQPQGNTVYRIDVSTKSVDQSISGGAAPHGVVVNKSGTSVYVTNLLSDDVSVIDTSSGKEVSRIQVGKMPNGISVWSRNQGGTP
ncbi:MAG: hypothetical protein ACYCZ0_00510 [Minisyncoccota bacterium]